MADPSEGVVQLHVDPVAPGKFYLGDATVVHGFVGAFAHDVMASYHDYLAGKRPGPEVQAEIDDLVRRNGDILMGRDERYQIAPWQGERLKGKFLAALPKMKGGDEPGDAMFRHLALQCVKASMALRDGKSDEAVGQELAEILDDARGRILGVIV